MKTRATIKRTNRRVRKQIAPRRATVAQPVILHRRMSSEFSCGVDFERAILVEESLDERERRG